jgi:hypothetical protein
MSTSKNRYFRLCQNMRVPGRWVLRETDLDERGQKLEPWLFDRGELVTVEAAPMLVTSLPGNPLDYSETGLNTPVVSSRVVSLLERLSVQDEVQIIQARVEGYSEPYFILNTLKTIRCIDDTRCEEVVYWSPEDNRPDKLGQYQNVVGMKIDPARVEGANIFRPWGWTVTLIVSERLKDAMDAEGITGTKFTEV